MIASPLARIQPTPAFRHRVDARDNPGITSGDGHDGYSRIMRIAVVSQLRLQRQPACSIYSPIDFGRTIGPLRRARGRALTFRSFSPKFDGNPEGVRTPLRHAIRIKGLPMATGTVKWYNDQKGYGFIQPDTGGKDVFVHVSAIERAGMRSLQEGQKVSYELETDKRSGKTSAGKLQAV